jgi:hypothetical protein
MRRCLHGGNQRLSCGVAFEAAKLVRCDDDHFVSPVHRYVLRAFTADAAHQFAKARFGVLQEPVAGLPAPTLLKPDFSRLRRFRFGNSAHADQILKPHVFFTIPVGSVVSRRRAGRLLNCCAAHKD